jgi:hypothetical protein
MTTATKRKHEKVKVVKPKTTEPTKAEDNGAKHTQEALLSLPKIDIIYKVAKGELHQYIGRVGQEAEWDKLANEIQSSDNTPYTFYQNGKPFYVAVQNGTIQPLTFPEPKDYGVTSPNLFAWAVTLADAVAEFIRLKIRGKMSLANKLMQPGVLGMALLVSIFLIFILIVLIQGGGK